MSNDLKRYSLIKTKLARELLLLQGKGCVWKKCTFCDYYYDTSSNPFAVNKPILDMITGETGVIDVINSGSAMELDTETISYIREKVKEKNIHTLWFEAHYLYHNSLTYFTRKFPDCTVKFRTGIETFNGQLRTRWNKGIPENVTAKDVAEYFKGVCLLIGVEGQTFDNIKKDINIALDNFEYFSINVFTENTTSVKCNKKLIQRFCNELMPELDKQPNVEILLGNTDLGVG